MSPSGRRHGLCRLPIASPQTQSDRRDIHDIPTVAFWLKDGDTGVCRLLRTAGLKPGHPSPSPLSRASPFPLSLSRPLGVPAFLGCLPRVEAAVLRRVSLCSCRGLVRAVRREEETTKPTRRPKRVRSSRGELSWLVWDAEDSLEFYPVQASQSFFSLPRSLRPRNRESSQQRQGARRAEEAGR
ncbi:hypothetical protein Taro_000794 [Colocasia esculenta]|uniref:Uncharacterized protein n=1 Tax=Colocasia esculenta TaxID=4460 RepID=A0A843TG42_COLES|nr:hypothetical protein [Colocasia esculenta]